ncbi:glycoside hydrolase domain-containing protein [Streptomyces sp. DSM 41524]|uniref:Glycoside hydrolase domain-containing protein n=1 Tax=Streptomyces asiaticus subsp. ignotus TaxID=3098222 RepID=A0ABU7PQX6_9ACTN|nr:glycoside hydrolase domain-containing protein [Streptomyces sp. DSM 41524]
MAIGALLAPLVEAPAASAAARADEVRHPVTSVDPLIGSAGGGNTYRGANLPFGMIAWSPTSTTGDQTNTAAANGYAYDTTRVRGFSLTHVNGAGCHPGAAGDVPIMPFVGEVDSSPTADTKDQKYAATFPHEKEKAEPGHYRVGLDSGASADLAVTERAGVGDPLRYDPTNEPGIHAPWLYNALGQPWKTQVTVRQIVTTVYGTGPKGLPGNDDLGTMSAWYVFAALGLYPQAPGRAEALLTGPLFPYAEIAPAGRRRALTIDAPDASDTHPYVHAVRVNGRPHATSWLDGSVVRQGGSLSFDLADRPDTGWATAPGRLPR